MPLVNADVLYMRRVDFRSRLVAGKCISLLGIGFWNILIPAVVCGYHFCFVVFCFFFKLSTSAPFFVEQDAFMRALLRRGAPLRVLQAAVVRIHRKVQQAKGRRQRTATQCSVCFLTLDQMKGRRFAQQFAGFHCIYLPLATVDASKIKLVVLGELEGARQSLWLGGNRIQKIQLCVYQRVFVSFPRIHIATETPDVLLYFTASCPRREESHLLEELCC